ncbi:hypothetical protein QP185_16265 [Sphingomonas aerolata]|uniref:hypothetical protein n=1 Tax=Sphingomonas aerolata TaxID=185951 RepID=UPI002FE0EC65
MLMTFSPGVLPNAYPTLATIACGDRAFCRFMAWADKTKAATSTPLTPAQSAAITFSYLRDRSADYEKALWNCQQVRRPDPTQCMRARQTLRAAPAAADKAAPRRMRHRNSTVCGARRPPRQRRPQPRC